MDYLGIGGSEFSNEKQSGKPAILLLRKVPFAEEGMIVQGWGVERAGLGSQRRVHAQSRSSLPQARLGCEEEISRRICP